LALAGTPHNIWEFIDWPDDVPGGVDDVASVYNNRSYATYIGECPAGVPSHCVSPPMPNGKDCMLPGGKRLNLSNSGNTYPDGYSEWHDIGYTDDIYPGTTC
jgi:hypothetical protein